MRRLRRIFSDTQTVFIGKAQIQLGVGMPPLRRAKVPPCRLCLILCDSLSMLIQEAEHILPVMEYLPGWKCDISGCRTWDELPENAKKYVEYVEKNIGCHIGYVSVGPERDSIIYR